MTEKNIRNASITDEQIKLYGTVFPLMKSIYSEIKDFSKKKQDDSVSLYKVKVINRLLVKAKEILKEELSIDYLDILEEDDLPSMGDAVLIVSQYISALEKFHLDHFHRDDDWSFGVSGRWE